MGIDSCMKKKLIMAGVVLTMSLLLLAMSWYLQRLTESVLR